MSEQTIKGILFDSGRVLNGPVTGHWFITPNFYTFVNKKKFLALSAKRRKEAFLKAGEYIANQTLIATEQDEYTHFLEYYRIFFRCLPELNMTDEAIRDVAKDLVFNDEKYRFYNDSAEIIPRLSRHCKLAVVSDAWPSLENVFKKAGLRGYFNSFVISSILGVAKPNERMYRTALEELGVSAEEAIFVDDSVRNCDGAKKLGVQTVLLCRDFKQYLFHKITCRNHKVVRDIRDLSKMNFLGDIWNDD